MSTLCALFGCTPTAKGPRPPHYLLCSFLTSTCKPDTPSSPMIQDETALSTRQWIVRGIIVGSVVLHYSDIVTDFIVIVQWFMDGDYGWACMGLFFTILPMVVLGLIVPTDRYPFQVWPVVSLS